MKKIRNMGRWFLTVLFMSVLLVTMIHLPASAAEEETYTITMTLERFALGGDFIIEPMALEVSPKDSYAGILLRVLKERNISYSALENTTYGFYLQGIDGVDCGSENIPDCVMKILDDRNMPVKGNSKDGLYEFSYTTGSGWMFYVNNEYVPVSMGNSYPKDGDVVRYMFTLCYGADLTGTLHKSMTSDGKDVVYYSTADKSKLIRYMGQINQDRARWEAAEGFSEAWEEALTVMAKMNAARYEVNGAYNWLKEVEEKLPSLPDSMVLSSEQLDLTVGETAELTCSLSPENSVTTIYWSSDKPSVAAVSNGVVKAAAAGTARIHAKTVNGPDQVCVVNVKDDAATAAFKAQKPELKAAAASYNSVKLSWKKVTGAAGYRVYRAASKNGTYKAVKTVTGGSTLSYTNGSLTPGTTYYYKIRAYRKSGDTTVYSNYSAISSAKPVLATPSVTVKTAGYNSVKLSWKKVTGAAGYKVYRAAGKNGTYKTVKTIAGGSTVSCTDGSLTTGTTYYYKIRAYWKSGSTTVYSAYSSIGSAKPVPAKAVISSIQNISGKKAAIRWKKVSGASGYKIYRATSKNGMYQCVKTVTSGSTLTWTNTGLKTGKTYYYRIRAYRTVKGTKIYGVYSDVKSVAVKK